MVCCHIPIVNLETVYTLLLNQCDKFGITARPDVFESYGLFVRHYFDLQELLYFCFFKVTSLEVNFRINKIDLLLANTEQVPVVDVKLLSFWLFR